MREDIRMKPVAEAMGFDVKVDHQGFWKPGVPNNAYSFNKGGYHVWEIRTGWRVARLNEDNYFCEHVTKDTLEEALKYANEKVGQC